MRGLLFIGYMLATAILMSMFILVPGVFRYAFSLGAVLLGVRFFRAFESKGARIGFIAATLVCTLFFPTIYVAIAYANGWPIDPKFIAPVTE